MNDPDADARPPAGPAAAADARAAGLPDAGPPDPNPQDADSQNTDAQNAGARNADSRDRADLFALALEAGGIGTLDVDLRTRVARRGGVGAAAFGLAGEEPLPHAAWLSLLHPADRGRVAAAFEAMLHDGARYDVEYRIRRKTDGAQRWVSVRARPLRDAGGALSRLIGVVRDITEQKQAEAALRESEARLRLAQRAARLGSFDWRLGARHAAVSEEYAEIHGLPAGTAADSYETWLARVHPQDRARASLEARAMLRGAAYDTEYRIIRPRDGAVRWLASRAETFTDAGGEDAGGKGLRVIGTVRDVTRRREIDDELRGLNEALEQRVREAVAAREAARVELARTQRLDALGQLAGGIAHDFNNVLQSMQGAAALIERRPDDADGVRRLARMSLEAAARGASVTRRLLAFARQGDLRAEPIDLAALLENLREMLTHVLGAGIAVALDIAPGTPRPSADKGQLETVLVNLATNARDAMPDGGTLTLAASAAEAGADDDFARAARLRPGAYARIVVGDTGTGMSAATLARASEPFFTTKPPRKGTGLGLTMAPWLREQGRHPFGER